MGLVKPSVPLLLSLNGGYVDTASFLALQGLFAAHVTGNFVTLGAALVLGTSGALAKLLALPVFCAVVVVTRLASFALPHLGLPVLRTMLGLKAFLLIVGAAMAIRFGPFSNGDSGSAIATGMVLVSAMAIQNAAHRIHMSSAPPTTLMTGTTTQIMIDLADRLRGLPAETAAQTRVRMRRMAAAVVVFAFGCASAALLFRLVGDWCFVVPPVLALISLLSTDREGGLSG
ncbi:MAG: hypothetical protein JWM91_2272 [Rhodospirillales bacterium]|nr:hypothetical protein [Rhodospirillales bacterium]